MKIALTTVVTAIGLVTIAQAQINVANYSFGKPGTASYEHFSFWSKNGQRTDIYYTYGADRKESKISYLKSGNRKGSPGFKLKFANNLILYATPKGDRLSIADASGNYAKLFSWEYEGPVNGIGTFCQPCAENERQAMQFLKRSYVR